MSAYRTKYVCVATFVFASFRVAQSNQVKTVPELHNGFEVLSHPSYSVDCLPLFHSQNVSMRFVLRRRVESTRESHRRPWQSSHCEFVRD